MKKQQHTFDRHESDIFGPSKVSYSRTGRVLPAANNGHLCFASRRSISAKATVIRSRRAPDRLGLLPAGAPVQATGGCAPVMAYDGRSSDLPAGLQPASTGSFGRSASNRGLPQLGPFPGSRPGIMGPGARSGLPVAASDMKTCDPLQPMAPPLTCINRACAVALNTAAKFRTPGQLLPSKLTVRTRCHSLAANHAMQYTA